MTLATRRQSHQVPLALGRAPPPLLAPPSRDSPVICAARPRSLSACPAQLCDDHAAAICLSPVSHARLSPQRRMRLSKETGGLVPCAVRVAAHPRSPGRPTYICACRDPGLEPMTLLVYVYWWVLAGRSRVFCRRTVRCHSGPANNFFFDSNRLERKHSSSPWGSASLSGSRLAGTERRI